MSNDIHPETRIQSKKVLKSLNSVRVHLETLQWDLGQRINNGEPLSPGFCDNACEEMRGWAMELVDAADGLEASLNA